MTATQPTRVTDATAAESHGGDRHDHDLAELLRWAATGSDAAFAGIYDLTASRVYGLALRLLEDPWAAEDGATGAYLEIWSTSPSFDPTRQSATAWVLATAHAHLVQRLRDPALQEQRHLYDQMFFRHEPGHSAAHSAQAERVREAVAAISAAQWRMLVLAYLDGHTLTEVALLTRTSTEAVAFRMRAGLTRMLQFV